ncbi:DDE-type integrase/transposase/recombinase [Amycolatopsis magusensis]|uniref:DDE-type integrase/transposase/recombinase n=1 Tax=Amycolatopsis magusensis TaxID=882444 RepID=UPI003C2B8718
MWFTDITEHSTEEGRVYCAAVMDAYSRLIIGWSIADHMRTELVTDALDWKTRDDLANSIFEWIECRHNRNGDKPRSGCTAPPGSRPSISHQTQRPDPTPAVSGERGRKLIRPLRQAPVKLPQPQQVPAHTGVVHTDQLKPLAEFLF